ncbi:MAG TPA: GMC family oxidoreductase N-terminal domain-containing protein [Gaiellaceae bacterium]|nr:GMC family oxidoreductase N-terminal domain-containing protein [Gaiellaceae bacterium]
MHDVVIVGAGTAGCVLASRLTENPELSVLLIEAGARARRLEARIPAAVSRLYRTEVDGGDSTVPQRELDGREVVFPRGRALGGSTVMNAMMVLRGHPSDYDEWAASGCPGWSWSDVRPVFARSAEGPFPLAKLPSRHVLSDAFVHAAQAAGIPFTADLNAEETVGVGFVPVSQRRGRRFSVVDGYLRPALRRPNLTVVTGALVSRILVESGRAVGVAYRPHGEDRDEEALAGRDVVLAAGAIGSPHLLQLSGIGPREVLDDAGVELVHELPGVGANLLDHLANGLLVKTQGVETLMSAESRRNLATWAVRGRGPLTSNLGEAVAFVRTRPDARAPDLELLFVPVLFEEEGLKQPTEHGFTLAVVLLQPQSAGTVSIRTGDPLAPAAIDPCYLTDPAGADMRTLLYGLRLARRVVAQQPLAGFVDEELLPGAGARTDDELVAHVRALSQTLYHPAGTCRMGTDALAVVDPQLRVRGIDRLRVVDASVIPRLPSGHTNWPVVMIAERAAELIAADE